MKNRVHIAHAGDAVPGGIEMPKPGGRGGSSCIAEGAGSCRIGPLALKRVALVRCCPEAVMKGTDCLFAQKQHQSSQVARTEQGYDAAC